MSWKMKTLTEEEVQAMEPALVVGLLMNLCSQIPNERMLPSNHNEEVLLDSLYRHLGVHQDTLVTRDEVMAALYEKQ